MQQTVEAQLAALDALLDSARTAYQAQLDAARRQLDAASTTLDKVIEAAKAQVVAAAEALHAGDDDGCGHHSRTNHGTIGEDDWRCDDCRARVPAPPGEED